MKTKIVGILVCMLLIAIAFPAVGDMNRIINDKRWYLDDTQNLEFASGEFIVKFTKDAAIKSPSITMLNEKYQVSYMEKVFINSEGTILDNIYLLSVPEGSDILSIVKDYTSNPNVVYAEPNGIVYLFGIPNDANFSKQWALHNTGQTGGTPDADIDAPEAWDIETGSSDVTIAIVDSGVDYNHPDLMDNIWVNEDEIPGNDIDDDGNGYVDDINGWDFIFYDGDAIPLDCLGHGTHCSGIASAVTNNSIGIAGVCWDCKIMLVQIFNETEETTEVIVANGIVYAADNGADVISMSFGWYFDLNLIRDAVDYAYDKGAVLVAAAGNSNTDEKEYPAGYDNVIAVAATTKNDKKRFTSTYGLWVDVAAPGEDIYSTTPTYPTIWTDLYGMKPYYHSFGGTSMACPHVAGLAGLILSKNPSYSNEKVRSIIRANVDPYDSDVYIGTGRINAYKALTEFYTHLDIEITGGLGVGATISYNGLGDSIGEPYEIAVTGGLLGLINKIVNGAIDIEEGGTELITSGLLLGLGGIEISVTVGVKEEIAEGMQLLIFTIVQ